MDRREFFKNICTEFDFSDDRESNRCIDVFGVLQDSIDDKVATIICLVINLDNCIRVLYLYNCTFAFFIVLKIRNGHEIFKDRLINMQCLGNHRQLLAKQDRGVQLDREHIVAPFVCIIL